MNPSKHIAAAIALGDEGVERDANGLPIAFRIWHAGNNPTDKGDSVLSERSAKMLIEEQARRGNLYSIDFDHASLNPNAPPEARRAAGWFRIEDRGGDLWATDVEWTEIAAAGLTKKPPEFRYFSPAYDVSKKTDEIVGLLNMALTNNPATWSVTALASRVGSQRGDPMDPMKKEEMSAALLAWAGDDDEKKAKAAAAVKAAFPEEAPKEEPKKEEPKAETKTAAEEPKKDTKAAAEEPKPETKEAKAATLAGAAAIAPLDRALARISELEADAVRRKDAEEKREREQIFASRPDIPKETKALLVSKTPAEIKQLFATIPQRNRPNQHVEVSITRGDGQEGDPTESMRATRMSDRSEELDRKMFGISSAPPVRFIEGNKLEIRTMTPSEARQHVKTIEARRTGASKHEVK